jgi:NAD(P)-dependent dehydrogenase (short-subunit alcohol dehydrogenase family)
MLTHALAVNLAPHWVQVNSILLGVMDTPWRHSG